MEHHTFNLLRFPIENIITEYNMSLTFDFEVNEQAQLGTLLFDHIQSDALTIFSLEKFIGGSPIIVF